MATQEKASHPSKTSFDQIAASAQPGHKIRKMISKGCNSEFLASDNNSLTQNQERMAQMQAKGIPPEISELNPTTAIKKPALSLLI